MMLDPTFNAFFAIHSDIASIDIILGILLIIGLIRGFLKGFIIELCSLLAWVVGVYGAIHFSYFLVDYLRDYVDWEEQYLNITAFILTLIILVLAVILIGKLFTRLAKFMALNLFNRILGGIFGLAKTIFLMSIPLLFIGSFEIEEGFLSPENFENSVLYKPIKGFGEKLVPSVMEKINEHTDSSLPFDFPINENE